MQSFTQQSTKYGTLGKLNVNRRGKHSGSFQKPTFTSVNKTRTMAKTYKPIKPDSRKKKSASRNKSKIGLEKSSSRVYESIRPKTQMSHRDNKNSFRESGAIISR